MGGSYPQAIERSEMFCLTKILDKSYDEIDNRGQGNESSSSLSYLLYTRRRTKARSPSCFPCRAVGNGCLSSYGLKATRPMSVIDEAGFD